MPALKISSPLISCKDELNVFEGLIKEGRVGEGVFGGVGYNLLGSTPGEL